MRNPAKVLYSIFDAMQQKKEGYELTVFGQFYHFFGLVFSNHYYLDGVKQAQRLQANPSAEASSGIH